MLLNGDAAVTGKEHKLVEKELGEVQNQLQFLEVQHTMLYTSINKVEQSFSAGKRNLFPFHLGA